MDDCAKSLELLSDYRDGLLSEAERALVRAHLADCPPCDEVFVELETIIRTALVLRTDPDGVPFPDEEIIWQRLSITKQTIH